MAETTVAPEPLAPTRDPLSRLEDIIGRLQGIAQGLREHHDEFSPDPVDATGKNAVDWLYDVLLDDLDRELEALYGPIKELYRTRATGKAVA